MSSPNGLSRRKTWSVAIIGDLFMLPEVFEEKISDACGDTVSIRSRQDDWPDRPMEHGYSGKDTGGIKEYFGTPEDVAQFVGDAEILVTHLAPMSRATLELLPNLRLVVVSRGGPVNVDMDAARERGVHVANAPGRNASAVAEFTIGAILSETRKIRCGHEALRGGEWRGDLYRADTTGRELNEMTVGVVGYGRIGTRVVRLLRAFGARILVHDPYVQLDPDDAGAGVELVGFERLLEESDLVTLHARVTPETTGMMNHAAFRRMRRGAILVNTARGPLCDYEALQAALKDGHLGGAALDTFDVEPVEPDRDLLRIPGLTVTPHIAGASVRTVTCAAEQAAEEVRLFISREKGD